MQITSVWLEPKNLAKKTAAAIKDDMEHASKGLLPQSVEKTAVLKEIHGDQSMGWYYALTDKKPAPGEFGYLVQGSFLTGEVLSVFTILHRAADSPDVPKVIQSLTSATYKK